MHRRIKALAALLTWAVLIGQITAQPNWRPGVFLDLTIGEATKEDVMRRLGPFRSKESLPGDREILWYPAVALYGGSKVEITLSKGVLTRVEVRPQRKKFRSEASKHFGHRYTAIHIGVIPGSQQHIDSDRMCIVSADANREIIGDVLEFYDQGVSVYTPRDGKSQIYWALRPFTSNLAKCEQSEK